MQELCKKGYKAFSLFFFVLVLSFSVNAIPYVKTGVTVANGTTNFYNNTNITTNYYNITSSPTALNTSQFTNDTSNVWSINLTWLTTFVTDLTNTLGFATNTAVENNITNVWGGMQSNITNTNTSMKDYVLWVNSTNAAGSGGNESFNQSLTDNLYATHTGVINNITSLNNSMISNITYLNSTLIGYWNFTNWVNQSGLIINYSNVNDTQFKLDQLCATDGKILKRIGGVWVCAVDQDTVGGGASGYFLNYTKYWESPNEYLTFFIP
jgi:hypothetical protein